MNLLLPIVLCLLLVGCAAPKRVTPPVPPTAELRSLMPPMQMAVAPTGTNYALVVTNIDIYVRNNGPLLAKTNALKPWFTYKTVTNAPTHLALPLGIPFMELKAPTNTGGSASVTLAWNQSTDPIVAGYNIYYGGKSGIYTNEITVGNATNVTIVGFSKGVTYYFAATTYSAAGVESSFSSEIFYTVPLIDGLLTLTLQTERRVVK